MLSTTAFVALAMQCAASIHPDTAQEVARVESGFNPYAIAEIIPKNERKEGDSGVISHFPKTKEDALKIVQNIESRNRRYSVGLMQITSTNFSQYGVNADKLFSPCTNLAVFEKVLLDCYTRGGNLKNALSCYYSGNFSTGKKTESGFGNTSYNQRIGYNQSVNKKDWEVPSVREDIKKNNATQKISNRITTIYPQYAMRGTALDEKETTNVERE